MTHTARTLTHELSAACVALAWEATQRCELEDERMAPLLNIAIDFINENNKNIFTNGWQMLAQEFRDSKDSSAWLQETYATSPCEDLCGYLAWEQDMDGTTYIAAQFRCQKLNSKGARELAVLLCSLAKRCSSDCDCYRASAALEIWVDRRKPNEIYNYEYSCWASTDETAIIPMPPCTYTADVTAAYAGYTRVTPTCDASHPIVADCLMLAAASTGMLLLAIVVAPCLLLLASYCYIKTHRKLAEEMEEEMVASEKGKRRKRDKVTREYKSKSKAEGKYDDVRDMYADTAGLF
eukprot:COSAG06_NODE_5812_length_3261_cov_1.663820_2_plen_294_part_00